MKTRGPPRGIRLMRPTPWRSRSLVRAETASRVLGMDTEFCDLLLLLHKLCSQRRLGVPRTLACKPTIAATSGRTTRASPYSGHPAFSSETLDGVRILCWTSLAVQLYRLFEELAVAQLTSVLAPWRLWYLTRLRAVSGLAFGQSDAQLNSYTRKQKESNQYSARIGSRAES